MWRACNVTCKLRPSPSLWVASTSLLQLFKAAGLWISLWKTQQQSKGCDSVPRLGLGASLRGTFKCLWNSLTSKRDCQRTHCCFYIVIINACARLRSSDITSSRSVPRPSAFIFKPFAISQSTMFGFGKVSAEYPSSSFKCAVQLDLTAVDALWRERVLLLL